MTKDRTRADDSSEISAVQIYFYALLFMFRFYVSFYVHNTRKFQREDRSSGFILRWSYHLDDERLASAAGFLSSPGRYKIFTIRRRLQADWVEAIAAESCGVSLTRYVGRIARLATRSVLTRGAKINRIPSTKMYMASQIRGERFYNNQQNACCVCMLHRGCSCSMARTMNGGSHLIMHRTIGLTGTIGPLTPNPSPLVCQPDSPMHY